MTPRLALAILGGLAMLALLGTLGGCASDERPPGCGPYDAPFNRPPSDYGRFKIPGLASDDPDKSTGCTAWSAYCCPTGWRSDCLTDDPQGERKPAHKREKRVAARVHNQACDVCDDGVPYCDDGTECPEDDSDDKPA